MRATRSTMADSSRMEVCVLVSIASLPVHTGGCDSYECDTSAMHLKATRFRLQFRLQHPLLDQMKGTRKGILTRHNIKLKAHLHCITNVCLNVVQRLLRIITYIQTIH